MENAISAGDYIVFTLRGANVPLKPLGGPWGWARVTGVNAKTYSVAVGEPVEARWVYRPAVRARHISPGEARACAAALNQLERDYITAKDALKPDFLSRIPDILVHPFRHTITEGE